MSRHSKQRRDARKKKQGGARSTPPSWHGSPRSGANPFDADPFGDGRFGGSFDPYEFDPYNEWDDEYFTGERQPDLVDVVSELVRTALEFATDRRRNEWQFNTSVARLASLTPQLPTGFVDDLLAYTLANDITKLFENGWQPVELAHVVGRKVGRSESGLLAVGIGMHAAMHHAFEKAPPGWLDQLSELAVSADRRPASEVFAAWRNATGYPPSKVWRPALVLLSVLGTLGRLPVVELAPQEWGRKLFARTGSRRADSKVLARIRGLLAKAESSEFAEEAEALSTKAQQLMTRHAIESAVLDAAEHVCLTDQVEYRRVLIANPYPEAKEALLSGVGSVNGVKAVSHGSLGLVSIVGMPVDLDMVELLYTSLLVQGTNAVREAGKSPQQRTSSFRRSFLLAYAQRVHERLVATRDEAAADASTEYGKELVPVLAERGEAVDAVCEELFPGSYSKAGPAITNRAGWIAGRTAAEFADLTGGRGRIGDRSA